MHSIKNQISKRFDLGQIKQKAKAGNKYIFVDSYTTGCVPCKVMANDVFPQPEVSSFFNDRVVNLPLQFDEKKNGADIKRWLPV